MERRTEGWKGGGGGGGGGGEEGEEEEEEEGQRTKGGETTFLSLHAYIHKHTCILPTKDGAR